MAEPTAYEAFSLGGLERRRALGTEKRDGAHRPLGVDSRRGLARDRSVLAMIGRDDSANELLGLECQGHGSVDLHGGGLRDRLRWGLIDSDVSTAKTACLGPRAVAAGLQREATGVTEGGTWSRLDTKRASWRLGVVRPHGHERIVAPDGDPGMGEAPLGRQPREISDGVSVPEGMVPLGRVERLVHSTAEALDGAIPSQGVEWRQVPARATGELAA